MCFYGIKMYFLKLLKPEKPKLRIMSDKIEVICLYKNNTLKTLKFDSGITCENICISCCKLFKILPTTRLLFGLREIDTKEWLFPCDKPKINHEYEFRMRFKVPELDNLYAIDPNAYDYLYFQIRHDMVQDPDIYFPDKKNDIVGLGAVDMYIDFKEKQCGQESIEEICIQSENIGKSYQQYLPKKIIKGHPYFAKKLIIRGFKAVRESNKKLNYVKSAYMHKFAKIAPNYLRENYKAVVESLPDGVDSMDPGKYQITIELDLYGDEGPSIKVTQFTTQVSILLTKLEDLNALHLSPNQLGVDLNINGYFKLYHLEFKNSSLAKSFMTYVSGYLRLTTKWMFDPCVNFATPSLTELKALNCHGPVGEQSQSKQGLNECLIRGDYSYALIRESSNNIRRGTFILRECELEYDTYYIDIVGTIKETETYKVTRKLNQWVLHTGMDIDDSAEEFPSLLDLARGIKTDTDKRYQIPVSEYDKPLSLLICVPRNLLQKTTDIEVNPKKLQDIKRLLIFNPKKDILLYARKEKVSDCGKMKCHLAEWVQPNGIKNVKVLLKTLNNDTDYMKLLNLSDKWSDISSADFLKMYGLTLTRPYALVLEHPRYGSLDKFLQTNPNVSSESLLGITNCLFRAVGYMQEKKIYHGQIRCSSLKVTHYCPEQNLVVAKLADPGIPRQYGEKDLPWIPIELFGFLENKEKLNEKLDIYSDLWAFATTLWEIFARGKSIHNATKNELLERFRNGGAILDLPDDWPEEIRQIIMSGWSQQTDLRFDKMDILVKLSNLQRSSELSSKGPENICLGHTEDNSDDDLDYKDENKTDEDECPYSGIAQNTTKGKLIKREKIGQGHFGKVYRGELHYNNSKPVDQVAIKVLINNDGGINVQKDFEREIGTMLKLDHQNIVKIITFTFKSPMIVMEYLNGRSLKNYILQQPNLSNKKLLNFALQIATGMKYVGEQGFIHRDLAARNVLVKGEIVKISDFGLTQRAGPNGEYVQGTARPVPIKWYAIESLETEKPIFSSSSDVWSYGVTLFEIFSKGNDPNLEGISIEPDPKDFLKKLKDGVRLKKHIRCPQIVYEKMMAPCWEEEQNKRPSFSDLITIINNILNECKD